MIVPALASGVKQLGDSLVLPVLRRQIPEQVGSQHFETRTVANMKPAQYLDEIPDYRISNARIPGRICISLPDNSLYSSVYFVHSFNSCFPDKEISLR